MKHDTKFDQSELGYVYNRGRDLAEAHPDIAEKYNKIIQDYPHFDTLKEAVDFINNQDGKSISSYQIWAKVGKDEEYFYIQDYYIATNDNKIAIAADYIGMEQINY